MPTDERTFASEVAGRITEILNGRPDLPFSRATVEEHVAGTARRHDFRLYTRGANRPALTGEIKMPDTQQGRHPLNADLVQDALTKAFEEGVQYCFTWNVRDFVLFDTHMQGVPFAQRNIEGPTLVVDAVSSDDVQRDWAREAISDFWEDFLERFSDLLQGRRDFQPLPLDRRFILWLEAALEDPIAHTSERLAARSSTDSILNDRLTSWMLAQGWEPSANDTRRRQNLERASRLACYILVTRLVFYQALRRRFPTMSPISVDGVATPEQLQATLDARFREAVRYSRDYETVFIPDEADIGYSIPFLSAAAPSDWSRLIERIEEFDFSALDFDVIGQMYERLISPNERRRFGQFYTSPDVVDLINSFCIRNPDDRVLDPACGGGTFLVRAYSRKRALAGSALNPDSTAAPASHEVLLSQIFGIDIAAFPAQLSTINLAVRHLSDEANYPRVARASFFDAQAGIPLYDIPMTGDSVRSVALEKIDAVVGNPPYIRQEAIDRISKSNYAELFRREWPSHTALSGRSDIYAYFFTHAAHLLEAGGYLGFVTSVGWLDTDYGFKLQEFFLRNFRIVAVIESQVDKWFEDARVTTAVTILQREPDRARRDSNPVRFIQLRKPIAEIYEDLLSQTPARAATGDDELTRQLDMNAVRDHIERVGSSQATDYWRVQMRTQRQLWEDGAAPGTGDAGDDKSNTPAKYAGGKWGQYLRAPDSWFQLLERSRERMTPLQELALVRFGFKTGADRFYCVRDVTAHYLDETTDDNDFQDRWGISRKDTRRIRIIRDGVGVEHLVERRFLEPELHSLMEVKRAVVRRRDVGRVVINASTPRARIRRTHFADYVSYAERQGWNSGPTIDARARTRAWYDLGLRPKGERSTIVWSKAQQYRHVVPLNKDKLPVNSALYDLWARDNESDTLLWAMLNSTFVALSKYQFARSAGVEGNAQVDVISANMMLVPDIRLASPDAAARAIAACERMSRRNAHRFLYDEFKLDDRRDLDDAVLEILGIQDAAERAELREQLYRDVADLQRAIREREIVAQRDRRRSARRGASTPQDIADELWDERESTSSGLADLDMLQFPEDFLTHPNAGEAFDLPSGEVEVGVALMDVDGLLSVGQIRVGGRNGEVLEVGSVSRARYLEALSQCHRAGRVAIPDDETCDTAISAFDNYREELQSAFNRLAAQRTPDARRRHAITAALLRKALQWRREA